MNGLCFSCYRIMDIDYIKMKFDSPKIIFGYGQETKHRDYVRLPFFDKPMCKECFERVIHIYHQHMDMDACIVNIMPNEKLMERALKATTCFHEFHFSSLVPIMVFSSIIYVLSEYPSSLAAFLENLIRERTQAICALKINHISAEKNALSLIASILHTMECKFCIMNQCSQKINLLKSFREHLHIRIAQLSFRGQPSW